MATMQDGRKAQFEEMMAKLGELTSKYRGVRGELLAKVADELAALDPGKTTTSSKPASAVKSTPSPVKLVAPPAPTPAPPVALPSCRACGRSMKDTGHGALVCQNGHTRLLAG